MKIRSHASGSRPRGGITLTEILISIFIMGVGMLSLATLFPLGLQRLRDAARSSRSAMLVESATSEIAARDLLLKQSFSVNGYPYDPFTQDPESAAGIGNGINRNLTPVGPGLPICYDPLWWYQVYSTNAGSITPTLASGAEYRFAAGIGSLRNDPSGGTPSAHGLQRITNFPLQTIATTPPTYALDPAPLFASPDDLVMQSDGTPDVNQGRGSPLVPDLSTSARMYDYSYTWMFTGKQTDVANGTIFDGDLVVFHNRPFSVEQRSGVNVAAGERVVEAIWGYSSVPGPNGYGRNSRSVLLRWPNTQSDPEVRKGGWIADVTYERVSATELSRFYPGGIGAYPAQRCHWYRITNRTEPTADHELANYREMVVTLGDDVRAKTPLNASGQAVHVNAALVSPFVVNVVSRVFYSR